MCLVLALLTVLCCFRIDAAILNLLGSVFRGLIGAGFYILPFSFVMSFLILILHDGRPVALRVTCSFLTAALVGSLVQLVGGSFDAPEGWEVVTALWDGGISGTAGGVLSGGLASLLAALISRIGAVIVVLNLFFVWKYSPQKPRYLEVFAKPVAASLLMGGAAWAIYGLASRVLDGAFLALAQQMFADPDKIQLWSVYLANAACVLLGILAGVIVYGVLVIALRILRAEDVRSIPRGEKLIKLLHLK